MSDGPRGIKQRMLFIASDHAGFELKENVLENLKFPGFTLRDLGPENADRVDYPDYAKKLCREMLKSPDENVGILICGSGQGMAMSANRFKGLRAALTWNTESTELARAHNNANIICLGARLIEPQLAVKLIETFLRTPFEGGRHTGRVSKIEC